jgi:hypothetical protein
MVALGVYIDILFMLNGNIIDLVFKAAIGTASRPKSAMLG